MQRRVQTDLDIHYYSLLVDTGFAGIGVGSEALKRLQGYLLGCIQPHIRSLDLAGSVTTWREGDRSVSLHACDPGVMETPEVDYCLSAVVDTTTLDVACHWAVEVTREDLRAPIARILLPEITPQELTVLLVCQDDETQAVRAEAWWNVVLGYHKKNQDVPRALCDFFTTNTLRIHPSIAELVQILIAMDLDGVQEEIFLGLVGDGTQATLALEIAQRLV